MTFELLTWYEWIMGCYGSLCFYIMVCLIYWTSLSWLMIKFICMVLVLLIMYVWLDNYGVCMDYLNVSGIWMQWMCLCKWYADYVRVFVGVFWVGIAWLRLGMARHDMNHENTLGNDKNLWRKLWTHQDLWRILGKRDMA